jgi:hypothetical protein
MATAPKLGLNSPDTSELGINVFSPKVDNKDTVIKMQSPPPKPNGKNIPYDSMSERAQVRHLWGSRRRKHKKTRKAHKKRKSTRRK